MICAREISARELVDICLERIERIDTRLNSFREVFADDARRAAALADERVAHGEIGPLLGVPVAFKDEVDLAGRVTRHGTNAYDKPAAANSVHVQRILDAGAIALGVTNLPELAICGFTESAATGDTRNPWHTSRTPGGSSGGSAAAVAAGLVGAASASDGAGSIRIPAAFTGIVGLMPQRGRISLMPEDQHWYGLSRTGCLSRRVVDTALWLDIAAGPAPGDAHVPPAFDGSYVTAATKHPPRLRIATSLVPPRSIVPPIIDDCSTRRGGRSRRPSPGSRSYHRRANTQLQERGQRDPGALHPRYPAHYETVPHPDRLERRTRGVARYGRIIPDRVVRTVLEHREVHARRINEIFDDVDILLTPVAGTAPVEIGHWRGRGALRTVLGMGRVYPFTAVWNYTGQPAIAVPAGLSADALPSLRDAHRSAQPRRSPAVTRQRDGERVQLGEAPPTHRLTPLSDTENDRAEPRHQPS